MARILFLIAVTLSIFNSLCAGDVTKTELLTKIGMYFDVNYIDIMSGLGKEIAEQSQDAEKTKLMKSLIIDSIKAYPRDSYDEKTADKIGSDTKLFLLFIGGMINSPLDTVKKQFDDLRKRIADSFMNGPIEEREMDQLRAEFKNDSREIANKILMEYKKRDCKIPVKALPRSVVASVEEITGAIIGIPKRQDEYDAMLNRYTETFIREFLNQLRANEIWQVDTYSKIFYMRGIAYGELRKKISMGDINGIIEGTIKANKDGHIVTDDLASDLVRTYHKCMELLRK